MKKIWIGAGIFLILLALAFAVSRYLVSRLDGRGVRYQAAVVQVEEKPVSVLFVGDIMLDRLVRTTIEDKGFAYPFEDIKSIFENNDLVVGNLEGTITASPSISQKDFSKLVFTFDPSVARNLKDLAFSVLSLANNHTDDFGPEGLLETQTNLAQAGLSFFGSPSNDISLSTSIEVRGQHLCFVGYHEFNRPSIDPIIAEIQSIKPGCDYTTVFAHWGTEYELEENTSQKTKAHAFIDAGADLVIGAHPHVIQPVEVYKDKAIFYSLGNFIFDQDFSLPTRQGLAVQLELGTSTQSFHLIPIEMQKQKLSFPSARGVNIRDDFALPRRTI